MYHWIFVCYFLEYLSCSFSILQEIITLEQEINLGVDLIGSIFSNLLCDFRLKISYIYKIGIILATTTKLW